MKVLARIIGISICLLPFALEANYADGEPEWYAYLAVNRPKELKQLIHASKKWSSAERRMIKAAMRSDRFHDHKRALERLRDDHVQITVCNNGLDTIRLRYYKIKDASAATTTLVSHRMCLLRPEKERSITLLKDTKFSYQVKIPCCATCEQSGEHAHWSTGRKIAFEEGQSIELGSMIKSASKE